MTSRTLVRRPSTVAASALAGLALLAGCTPITFPGGGHGGGGSADVALRQAMNDLVGKPGGPPGILVAIGRGPHVSLRTAGVADTVTGARPAAQGHMRMASVAKAFSGAAALSLVSRGTLRLSDTIAKWLPHLPKAWAGVTLANLLGHTSGIPDLIRFKAFSDALQASLQTAPAPRVLLSYVNPPALAFVPGSSYAYSNSDNIVVGLMVEAATHRRYERVLATNVYAPLHLTQTSLPRGSALPEPVRSTAPNLRGYDTSVAPALDVTSLFAAGWSWAAGGVVSTPADALRFVRGYVSGRLVGPATRAAQFTFRPGSSEPPGPGANSAGLALFKYDTSCGTVYGHTGNTPGYTQFVAATRDGRQGVVVSINAQITPASNPPLFAKLRHIYELAVCAAD